MVDAVDDCVSLMRKLIRHANLHLCPSATPSRPNLRLARVINVHSDARNGGHNSGLDKHVTTYASTGQQNGGDWQFTAKCTAAADDFTARHYRSYVLIAGISIYSIARRIYGILYCSSRDPCVKVTARKHEFRWHLSSVKPVNSNCNCNLKVCNNCNFDSNWKTVTE